MAQVKPQGIASDDRSCSAEEPAPTTDGQSSAEYGKGKPCAIRQFAEEASASRSEQVLTSPR